MKTMIDYLPTMSSAVMAMVEGLKTNAKRTDFKISMDTFGDYRPYNGICYGCAATCTIQQATHTAFTGREIDYTDARADVLLVDADDLYMFESAIDSLRKGDTYELAKYYNIIGIHAETDLPYLKNDFTEEQLSYYVAFAEDLKEVGL